MKKKINDKLVLITGVSSGIGKGLAKKLCRNGYNLILTSRSNEKLSQLKDELSDFSEKIHLIACDLTNSDDVEIARKQVLDPSQVLGFHGILHSPMKVRAMKKLCWSSLPNN